MTERAGDKDQPHAHSAEIGIAVPSFRVGSAGVFDFWTGGVVRDSAFVRGEVVDGAAGHDAGDV